MPQWARTVRNQTIGAVRRRRVFLPFPYFVLHDRREMNGLCVERQDNFAPRPESKENVLDRGQWVPLLPGPERQRSVVRRQQQAVVAVGRRAHHFAPLGGEDVVVVDADEGVVLPFDVAVTVEDVLAVLLVVVAVGLRLLVAGAGDRREQDIVAITVADGSRVLVRRQRKTG